MLQKRQDSTPNAVWSPWPSVLLAWHAAGSWLLCYPVLLWSSDRPLARVPVRRLLWDWAWKFVAHEFEMAAPEPRTKMSVCINDQPKQCVAYRHSRSSLLYYHIMVLPSTARSPGVPALKSDSVFFLSFCENESASGLTTRKQWPKFLLHVL